MTGRRRHLVAALGLAALAAACFGLLAWALVAGSVVANFPSDARVRSDTAGHQYMPANTLYRREEAPGRYWLVVGLLGFFGSLFTVVSLLECRSCRTSKRAPKSEAPSPDLLAKIDRACRRYPEGREALVRAKKVMVDLNNPAVEASLDGLVEKVLRAPDREMALGEIRHLTRALDLADKF